MEPACLKEGRGTERSTDGRCPEPGWVSLPSGNHCFAPPPLSPAQGPDGEPRAAAGRPAGAADGAEGAPAGDPDHGGVPAAHRVRRPPGPLAAVEVDRPRPRRRPPAGRSVQRGHRLGVGMTNPTVWMHGAGWTFPGLNGKTGSPMDCPLPPLSVYQGQRFSDLLASVLQPATPWTPPHPAWWGVRVERQGLGGGHSPPTMALCL